MVPTPTRSLGLCKNFYTFILKLWLEVASPPLTDESVLMDLKALLVEAKQKVPPVLQVLQNGDETMLDIGGESLYTQINISHPLFACVLFFSFSHFFFFFVHLIGERGCTFCGGLGHRITDCPKLEAMQTKQVTNIGRKDYLAHSSMDF